MSAYTSQRWPPNGQTSFPGELRTPHDLERREYRGDHGENGVRQNGISDNYPGRESPHSVSPMTNGDSPAYNRSVCDGEEYGRSSPAAQYYSPPQHTQLDTRPGKYIPQEPRRNYHTFNGGPHPPRPYMQRPHRPPEHHHMRGSEPPHVRGYPAWQRPPASRGRPFFHNGHRPPPPSYGRSPILRSPAMPYRPHSPVDSYHSQYQDMSMSSVDRDPRLQTKSSALDVFPQGNHIVVQCGKTKEPPVHKSSLPDIELITKEHSYCDRALVGMKRKHSELESATDVSGIPRTQLSVIPKKFLSLASTQTNPQQLKKKSNLKPSKPPVPAESPSTEPVSISTSTSNEQEIYWPVGDSFPEDGFSMDFDPDIDSGVDSASEEERDEVVVVETTINEEQKASSLTNGLITKPHSLSDESQTSEGKKRRRRRSKKKTVEEFPLESLGEETPQGSPVLEIQGISEEQQVDKAMASVKDELKKTKRKAKKRLNPLKPVEKRMKKLFKQRKAALSDALPTELKILLSGDFKPEILTTRSRGESLTLARRQVMEEEIQQHERERILTAQDPEVEGTEDIITHVGFSDIMDDDFASEHSAATTTSSSLQTMSQDQGSSSHDLDSSSHDLESMSLPSCDDILDEFSPELIARCKRISSAKSSGDTPLHKVCRNGRFDMAHCLLMALKVNPNQADNAGWTPLHEACCNNHPHIASLLLKSGADANASARDGTRPIHDAIEIGSIEIVTSLVQHGADPTAEVGDKTPLDIAKAENRTEIYNFLLPVVKEHQDRIKAQKAASAPPPVARRRSTRTAIVKSADQDEDYLTFPVDGFGNEDPCFGKELDFPLFYVCPPLELSESPMLPVYNFEIVPGANPRRHNFYLLTDLLVALSMNESELRQHCNEISALEMTVGEVLSNLKHTKYNKHMTVPANLKAMSKTRKVKFLPVCTQLRNLLGIETVHLDD